MIIERRKHQRHPLFLDLRLETASGRPEIRLSDLSVGGCYIDTIGQVAIGEEVSFEINSPTGQWIPFRGMVAHVQQGFGFGVRFAPLSADQQAAVALMINSSQGSAVSAPAQLSAYAA